MGVANSGLSERGENNYLSRRGEPKGRGQQSSERRCPTGVRVGVTNNVHVVLRRVRARSRNELHLMLLTSFAITMTWCAENDDVDELARRACVLR